MRPERSLEDRGPRAGRLRNAQERHEQHPEEERARGGDDDHAAIDARRPDTTPWSRSAVRSTAGSRATARSPTYSTPMSSMPTKRHDWRGSPLADRPAGTARAARTIRIADSPTRRSDVEARQSDRSDRVVERALLDLSRQPVVGDTDGEHHRAERRRLATSRSFDDARLFEERFRLPTELGDERSCTPRAA